MNIGKVSIEKTPLLTKLHLRVANQMSLLENSTEVEIYQLNTNNLIDRINISDQIKKYENSLSSLKIPNSPIWKNKYVYDLDISKYPIYFEIHVKSELQISTFELSLFDPSGNTANGNKYKLQVVE
jgi:hypothetical protein